MTLHKTGLPLVMLALPTAALADGAVAPGHVMAASCWGYVAFLPVFIAAFVVYGWVIPPKR